MSLTNMENYISRSSSSLKQGDRFIPNRGSMNMDVSHYNLVQNENSGFDALENESELESQYKTCLAQSLFSESNKVEEHKILALKNKAPAPAPGYQNHLRVLYSQNASSKKISSSRVIHTKEESTLDAPGLVDDYYLNLLDWSSSNLLAVALGSAVYLWDAATGEPSCLCELEEEQMVTSVSWSKSPSQYLAVGTDENYVNLWDVERGTQVRRLEGHVGRVGATSWNGHILSSGSFDSSIINWDVRARNPRVSTFQGHQGEVCGLKWSPDGKQLASGGNDNLLNVWQMDQEAPKFTMEEHQAAVKAVAWCPWQPNLLASGGGTADRTIKFWNTQSGHLLNSVDTESQVCALQWSTLRKELVSSHGFSKNQLCVWKYPSMTKIAELTGHTARVLHMAQSPDGTSIISGGADETLKFWRLFESADVAVKKNGVSNTRTTSASRGIRSSMNKIR